LAALVASKVYFHLGEFDEALSFALGSAELFDVDSKDEYVDTVVCEFQKDEKRGVELRWVMGASRPEEEDKQMVLLAIEQTRCSEGASGKQWNSRKKRYGD